MQSQRQESEAVVVSRGEAGGWSWSVVGADRVYLQGRADDPASAYKTGAFAAGAMDALNRIGRRR